MAGTLPGKLIGVKVNGTYIRCQTDATLTITIETTDDEPCKPTEADTTNGASWGSHSVGTKNWNVSVTGKTFADTVAGFIDNSAIAGLMITGDPSVEITFQTIKTTDYDFDKTFIYEGTGTLSSFTQNAPIDGDATYDLEVTGNGALTYTEATVTP